MHIFHLRTPISQLFLTANYINQNLKKNVEEMYPKRLKLSIIIIVNFALSNYQAKY